MNFLKQQDPEVWGAITGDEHRQSDGRLDIVTKPYTRDTPRIDVWLNQGVSR